MKLGLVGYGFGGRIFHAPFIQAADGVEIGGVVARSADKIAQIAVDLPGVPVFASLSDLIADGSFDVVTITTPPATHTPLTLEAIEAGLHVVCDKPFSMNLRDAAQMAGAAKQKGVLLNVFQNRRRDTDLVTLASLIDAGELGDIQRVHNRMDFDQIETLERGPDGGLLRDLGSHLVDQMLWLLGPVEFVDAQINHLEFSKGRTDADFVIHLRHVSGAHSYVSASRANHFDARELRVYGTKGAYVVNGTDVQARAAIDGKRPATSDNWGEEPQSAWGTLYYESGPRSIPSLRSDYSDYYTEFAKAVRDGTDGPVPARQSLRTVEVLDAARIAAASGQIVQLDSTLQQTDTPVDWRLL